MPGAANGPCKRAAALRVVKHRQPPSPLEISFIKNTTLLITLLPVN